MSFKFRDNYNLKRYSTAYIEDHELAKAENMNLFILERRTPSYTKLFHICNFRSSIGLRLGMLGFLWFGLVAYSTLHLKDILFMTMVVLSLSIGKVKLFCLFGTRSFKSKNAQLINRFLNKPRISKIRRTRNFWLINLYVLFKFYNSKKYSKKILVGKLTIHKFSNNHNKKLIQHCLP